MKMLKIIFNSHDESEAKNVLIEKGKVDYEFLQKKFLEIKDINANGISAIFYDFNNFPEKQISLNINEETTISYPVGEKMQKYYIRLIEKDFSIKNLAKTLGN